MQIIKEDKIMWSDYIQRLKDKWIGKQVLFEGKVYTIVDVDMNGILHIDRPTEHNKTTAAFLPQALSCPK